MGLSQGGSSGGGGGGEANTSSNVGTGAQLAKPKVGVNLPFRTIKGGSNVTVTQNADEVEISAATGGDGEANTTSNVGTGEGTLAKPKVGVNLPIKSIKAGANIAIANNADDVTINISGTIPTGNQAPQTMAGDVTGTTAASVVSKVRGATIGTAAGALTPGHSLRVTGSSAIDYGPVDLANANATTGTLAVAKVAAPTSTGVAKVSSGAWVSAASPIVNADVDAAAAIAISKLAPGSNGQGIVVVTGVPTWVTVVTGVDNYGSGAAIGHSASSGNIHLRSIIGTSPITATQNTNDITLTLGTVPVAKGGTGLTSVGAANTVFVTNGAANNVAWSKVVDANVDDAAAITWSKFGGGTQTLLPTGFNFTGLARGRVYQRDFYDTLTPMVDSPYSRAKQYSFTLPDNATTKVTVSATTFNSSSTLDARNSNSIYEVVYRRVGGTVTKVRETPLLSVADFSVTASNTSSTCKVLVKESELIASPGTDTVAHVRIELDCVSTADLPAAVTVTSATP